MDTDENLIFLKYLRFLSLKFTNSIVQSRLGAIVTTRCNSAGTDWFNIAIQDHPDVLVETKKALQLSQSESVINRLPLCVEISLQVDEDKMILEVWSLNINTEISDPTSKTSYTVYNRMSILLKSLISITRVTPAYRLSRRQNPDSFSIYYRIYSGEPQHHNLGEAFKQARIGQVTTQIGTITMAVAYRTKMTISPTPGQNTIMLKSDHFLRDLSPKLPRYGNYNKNKNADKKVIDLDRPMKCGAFVDASRVKQYTEDDYILPETPPFHWLLRKPPRDDAIEEEKLSSSQNDENSSPNNNNLNNRIAEAAKLSQSPKDNVSGTSPSSLKSQSRWSLRDNKEDEKLLKELPFPFANQSPIGDLAKFYRDCFHAPPLESFTIEGEPTFEDVEDETVDDLTRQLEQFETSLNEYDGLITSLCVSESQNNT